MKKLKQIAPTLFFLMLAMISLTASFVFSIRGEDHPNQHSEAKYGRVKVGVVAGTWSEYNMSRIERALLEASRLGPTFVLVNGTGDVALEAGRWVADQHQPIDTRCTTHGAGMFSPHSNVIAIDPLCCVTDVAFQIVLIHELGHYLGMRHIKQEQSENCPTCATGYGLAIMNASNEYGSFSTLMRSRAAFSPATIDAMQRVSILDAAEARAALRGRTATRRP